MINPFAQGTPRTRDGKPNLAAPAPRAKGRPDLSGVWQVEPARPEADAITRKRASVDSPTVHCQPMGLPGPFLAAVPFKIVQTPGLTLILQEVDNTIRRIYTDGRPLPVDPQPSWHGYSIGKWEGDTFVVDTAGFNDLSWLDAFGHPHSDALRLQERFHRRDYGHLDIQITLDDPKTFTKPLTIKATDLLVPDSDIPYESAVTC